MTLPFWLQIVTLGIPVAVSIFSAAWATRSARRAQSAEHEAQRLRALEDRIAQKKYELYQPFLQGIGDMLTPSRQEAVKERLEDLIADFQTFVSVWGSDEVLEAFLRYRLSANTNPPSHIIIRLMADLLIAVRKDIAWPNTSITGMHAIGIRITDLADHPELQDAMTKPLPELFKEYNWTPPFKV